MIQTIIGWRPRPADPSWKHRAWSGEDPAYVTNAQISAAVQAVRVEH